MVGMITSTITVFPEILRDAEKVRDAMNATLPDDCPVDVQHVLSVATGIGVGELMLQFNLQPKEE